MSSLYFKTQLNFQYVLGIGNKISIFNVLTNFRYYFSKYEASDNIIPYQVNSPTECI